MVLWYFMTKQYNLLIYYQEEASRAGQEDRQVTVPTLLSEKKMDSAAVGNNNKVKVMATQLLAKFEENAPAQGSGLKRQVFTLEFVGGVPFLCWNILLKQSVSLDL